MRKPDICICENKDADQLHGDREADQRLCFRYTDSTIPLLPKSEISCLCICVFCDCTARFVSDLVENPEARFSQNEAQVISFIKVVKYIEKLNRTYSDTIQKIKTVNVECT